MDIRPIKPFAILFFLVIVTFSNSLHNSFVWDDYGLIVDNPKIDLPLKELYSVVVKPLWKTAGYSEYRQVYYRPAVSLLFVLNYKIWGLNPLGFHLTNLLLHLIAAFVLYKTGRILFEGEKMISLLAASIFAVHPVHNEPLGRAASGEVIFGFFVILSIYFFLKDRRYLSWSAFLLALLSKEAAVMLPFGLVILSIHRKGLRKGLIRIIPHIMLVGVYLILRMLFVDTVLGDSVVQPATTRILTMAVAAFDYIRLLIIPYPLTPFYPARWYTSLLDPKAILSVMLLFAIILLAVKLRNDRVMLFLMALTLLILAPVIWRVNTFPAGGDLTYINERFLYVPAMTFALFSSALAIKFGGARREKYIQAGGVIVTAVFACLSIYSGTAWKNNLVLFGSIVKSAPGAGFAHHGLANSYKEAGFMEEALEEWQKSVELNPSNSQAWNSIGNIYVLKGNYEKAIYPYQMSLKTDPKNVEAYYNLAITLEKTGREKEAIIYYREFIRLAPESYSAQVSELRRRFGSGTPTSPRR